MERTTEVPIEEAIVVDAACSGNPGVMEYRGVYLPSRSTIFEMGPFPKGTNNIGEFLAIDTALDKLQSGDICLILIDQVDESLAHIAKRVAEQ